MPMLGLCVLTLAFRAVEASFETYRDATHALEQAARVSDLAQEGGCGARGPALAPECAYAALRRAV